jgi:phosphoglycolate phosphatase-like HAD superfamily hydrolase
MHNAVYVDFDDTLVETRRDRADLLLQTVRKIRSGETEAQSLDDLWGRPFRELVWGLAGPTVDIDTFIDEYCARMEAAPPPRETLGTSSFLECMRANRIAVVVVTASDSRVVRSDINRFAWSNLIEVVLGSDVLPGDKSDFGFANAARSAIGAIGLSPLAMVGNSVADRCFARNADLRFFGVPSDASDRIELQRDPGATDEMHADMFGVAAAIVAEVRHHGTIDTRVSNQ